MEMAQRLGLTNPDGSPSPAMEPFIKAHYEWAVSNGEFIKAHLTKEKALEYVMAHR